MESLVVDGLFSVGPSVGGVAGSEQRARLLNEPPPHELAQIGLKEKDDKAVLGSDVGEKKEKEHDENGDRCKSSGDRWCPSGAWVVKYADSSNAFGIMFIPTAVGVEVHPSFLFLFF